MLRLSRLPPHRQGRVAFACPRAKLPEVQARSKATGNTVLTELVSLPTPGKADVEVVILADPDGFEICFVGSEAFRELSETDPAGGALLDAAMAKDESDAWHIKVEARKKRAETKKNAAA